MLCCCVCCLIALRSLVLLWCSVRQNNSVGGCNSVGVVIHKVIGGLWIVLLVWMVLWIEWG